MAKSIAVKELAYFVCQSGNLTTEFFSNHDLEAGKKAHQHHQSKYNNESKKEFYVTVLMMYTDYCKTLGTANFDVYLKLAKDWLVDDDIAVQGGEKLAAYHDKIVLGM